MSNKNVITNLGGRDNIKQVAYATMVNGDIGDTIGPDMDPWSDRSVQVAGTFGSGGSVAIEGSNDGTNWAVLNSPDGTSLAVTTAGIKQILQNALYLRPHVTGGDGTTNVAVTFALRLPAMRPV